MLFVLVDFLLQVLALALVDSDQTEADFAALALRLLFLAGLLVVRVDRAHKELSAHFVREGEGGGQADAHSLLGVLKLVFSSFSERKSFECFLLQVLRVEPFARVDNFCNDVACSTVEWSVEVTLLKRHKRNLNDNSAVGRRELQGVIENVEKYGLVDLEVRA